MRRELSCFSRFDPSRERERIKMAGRSVSRAWTEVDIEQLKALAGKQSTAQIAIELDRTIGGILQKAFDLKLSLRVRPQDEPKPPLACSD